MPRVKPCIRLKHHQGSLDGPRQFVVSFQIILVVVIAICLVIWRSLSGSHFVRRGCAFEDGNLRRGRSSGNRGGAVMVGEYVKIIKEPIGKLTELS